MSILTIRVSVPDSIDPTLNDPDEIAEAILGPYEDEQQCNPHLLPITWEYAEWDNDGGHDRSGLAPSAAIRCDAFGRTCDKVTHADDKSWHEVRQLDPKTRARYFCSLKCLNTWSYCAQSSDNCK